METAEARYQSLIRAIARHAPSTDIALVNKAYEFFNRAYNHGIHYASTMISRIDKIKKEKLR